MPGSAGAVQLNCSWLSAPGATVKAVGTPGPRGASAVDTEIAAERTDSSPAVLRATTRKPQVAGVVGRPLTVAMAPVTVTSTPR